MGIPVSGTVVPHFDQRDIAQHKAMAALSYLGLLCLIPLLAARTSRYAQEHARQGIVLVAVWVLGGLIFWVPFVGQVAILAVFLANLIVFVKCVQGEFWEIPYIGVYRRYLSF